MLPFFKQSCYVVERKNIAFENNAANNNVLSGKIGVKLFLVKGTAGTKNLEFLLDEYEL